MRTRPAAAIPTFAPSDSPPAERLNAGGVADADVMLTGVVENSEPWMEMVLPGVGC